MRQGKMQDAIRHPDKTSRIIDLNSATEEEIAGVAGLGPELAKAISEHRPLEGWDHLSRVPGFSEDIVRRLRSGGVQIRPRASRAG